MRSSAIDGPTPRRKKISSTDERTLYGCMFAIWWYYWRFVFDGRRNVAEKMENILRMGTALFRRALRNVREIFLRLRPKGRHKNFASQCDWVEAIILGVRNHTIPRNGSHEFEPRSGHEWWHLTGISKIKIISSTKIAFIGVYNGWIQTTPPIIQIHLTWKIAQVKL